MRILVIGGSGFIGTNLVAKLIDKGHQVKIYDKRLSDAFPEACIVGDIRDRENVTKAMDGIDVVYHLAAEHRDDVLPISLYYDVNVGGANNIVHALKERSIKQLIFTSTVAVYGLNQKEPDEDCEAMPFNDYGKSKYESEIIFKNWANEENKSTLAIVRPTVVFGENNRGNVYNLLSQIASNKFLMIGNGKNKKSLAYVLNIAHFLVSLLELESGVHVYNYADKPDLTMNELIESIYKNFGRKTKPKISIPYSIGLIFGYLFDFLAFISRRRLQISSIRIKKFCADTVVSTDRLRNINFVPSYTIEEGLKRTINNEFLQRVSTI